MNVIAWARVSSGEQKEGYSLDAQMRAIREKADKQGWKILKEFSVAESAKRNTSRAEFEAMMGWIKKNAKKEEVKGVVFHKLDRACRNMRDAVRLQELEDTYGVRPLFIDNQFGEGPAGQLSFNVMAAFAQYFSDNLRTEVQKGMIEKATQGWLPAHAPYGYINSEDPNEPIKPHPENARVVQRIFELYAQGNVTFDSMSDLLNAEGLVYQKSSPRFYRTVLSYILNNRFYIGEVHWHGRVFQGKHRLLINRETFEQCQDILSGKIRRRRETTLPFSGGLFRCQVCGAAMTAELIKKKLRSGKVNEHLYYRCTNNDPAPDHPKVRWKAEALDAALLQEVKKLKLPSQEIIDWFRTALRAALSDEEEYNRVRTSQLHKRQSELLNQRSRLLDVFLSGSVDKSTYEVKAAEINAELERVGENLTKECKINGEFIRIAETSFNVTQNAADSWVGSSWIEKRDLLDILTLNRELGETSLCLTWNKPFDVLAKQADFGDGTPRGT